MSFEFRSFAFAVLILATACGPAPRNEPIAPLPSASPVSTVAAIPTTSATAAPAPIPPVESDIISPLLPFALSKLPAALSAFGLDNSFVGDQLLEAACGRPDVERRLLSMSPVYETRGLANAFSFPEETRKILQCRRELSAKLGATTEAWEIVFPLPGQSGEYVRFFRLDIENLPPTASYGHDAARVTGLPWARCYYAFHMPNLPCSELSDAVGKWPEGNLWITGRINGISAAVEAYHSGKIPHPRAAEVRTALDAGKDFNLSWLSFDNDGRMGYAAPGNFVLAGREKDGTRVSRYVLKTEDDAILRQKELEQEREKKLARPIEKSTWRCTDCPPGFAALLAKKYAALDARERKVTAATIIRRDGRMVEQRVVPVEDAEYAKIEAALEALQAKRTAKVMVLLDQWTNGKPPKPEAFVETQGRAFLKALDKEMTE